MSEHLVYRKSHTLLTKHWCHLDRQAKEACKRDRLRTVHFVTVRRGIKVGRPMAWQCRSRPLTHKQKSLACLPAIGKIGNRISWELSDVRVLLPVS